MLQNGGVWHWAGFRGNRFAFRCSWPRDSLDNAALVAKHRGRTAGVGLPGSVWWRGFLLESNVKGANNSTMRLSSSSALVLGALLLSVAQRVNASPVQFQSGVTQTSLLELYTSEGCSSCPPAEAWMSRLKEHRKLWKDFVPVAFHVDYWDYLGWKDPFASKAYAQRQHDYANRWRSRSVYTPGFVLDGEEWTDWPRHNEIPSPSSKPAGVLTARSTDGRDWTLRFQPPVGSPSVSSYDFHAALLGFELISDVKAGENRGHKLMHEFVVLAVANAAATASGDAVLATITLTPKLKPAPKRLAFATWVTPSRGLQPVQAVGGWLSSTNQVL